MSMGSGTKILLAELIMILVVLIVFWIVIVFIRSNAELRYLRDALRDADSAGERRYWRRQLRCRYLRLLPFVSPRNAERIYGFLFHGAGDGRALHIRMRLYANGEEQRVDTSEGGYTAHLAVDTDYTVLLRRSGGTTASGFCTLTLTDGAGGVVSYRTDMIEGDYTLRIMSDRSLLLTAEAVGCKKLEHMPDIPVAANGTVVVIPPAERSSADVSYF